MSATVLVDDLETYVGQYGTHGAVQRLQFVAAQTDNQSFKIDALRLCFDKLKHTNNSKAYSEVHAALRDALERSEHTPPTLDSVWVETTQKQASYLRDLFETDLQTAKNQQLKEAARNHYWQLVNHCIEQGDYSAAQRHLSGGREFFHENELVVSMYLTFIRISSLLRQYTDLHSLVAKASCFTDKDSADQSKINATAGLYYMTQGKFYDAAVSFMQVRPQELTSPFTDILCPQDVALYGVLCALASHDRGQIKDKLKKNPTFERDCLDLVPQARDLMLDFCNCKYAACLSVLDRLKPSFQLDIHLHDQAGELCKQIRSRAIVQYFTPFMSVSLHAMAQAFNTDTEGMQAEVAELVRKGQLDAKIDSHQKILYMRHENSRMSAYQNAMRVSDNFLNTTHALILRMNVLKHDFGIHTQRPARSYAAA